ncbi:hypothetical protein L1987_85855 [Smallanthus sonchifolius]|uniref:Uncharacterized protein n=1 Tax=Smallanthus sonchifolius TaxID=185202 RepID=A0ACB8XYH4_9ASTR|nr:hypothetical protein L1987_85855 [Smallanthus sonchifolius]
MYSLTNSSRRLSLSFCRATPSLSVCRSLSTLRGAGLERKNGPTCKELNHYELRPYLDWSLLWQYKWSNLVKGSFVWGWLLTARRLLCLVWRCSSTRFVFLSVRTGCYQRSRPILLHKMAIPPSPE